MELNDQFENIKAALTEQFKNYSEYIPDFHETSKPLFDKTNELASSWNDCLRIKQEIEENNKKFDEKYGSLVKPIEKIEQVPQEVPHEQEEKNPTETQENAKKEPSKEEKYIVPPITKEEFNTIPKYMLGRFTLDMLNEIAAKFDEFLVRKHKIYSKPQKTLTRLEREQLDKFREMEEKAKKLSTVMFCVESDIRPLVQDKLKSNFSKSIPCLRHIRRIREERCGAITFYFP